MSTQPKLCLSESNSAVRLLLLICLLLAMPGAAHAHIGSKDVFEQVNAGPYRLFVTVRPPMVIPGVATVEIRTSGPQVQRLQVTPVPMVGEASKHPPTPDAMHRSAVDPAFFTGSLWLMSQGSWKVVVAVDGEQGSASTSVPVPALPLQVLRMDRSLGLILGLLAVLLVVGIVGIVAAAARESRLEPGITPSADRRRRALFAGGATLAVMALAIWLGGRWWDVEAADYSADIYQPLALHAALAGSTLDLRLGSYDSALKPRRSRLNTDLLPDHGHLMHLYVIREPEMDAVYHLHPDGVAPGELQTKLPDLPPGRYRLFADIVHRSGLPETLTSTLEIPSGFHGGPLDSEDAAASPAPLSAGELSTTDKLPDGYSMAWDKPATLTANEPVIFRFRLLNAQGQPATDVVPYLGMAGHAAFVKTDWSTFAHTHPEGSAPMPSMMVANGGSGTMDGMNAPGESSSPVSSTVEFPYGFPARGRYRIFVQMKHGTTVETGTFDAEVR
ncbi:MAG: hypothetical protein ACRYGF_00670 [Janthinobacterium lividum]